MNHKYFLLIACVLIALSSLFSQEQTKDKYAADVPDYLLTPDTVETDLLGPLAFFDGLPTEETVNKTYDFLTVSRGVKTFLDGMPAASLYAMLEGLKAAGVKP